MKVLIRKFQAEWPAWTAIAFIALLPLNRSEIPLLVFAFAMPFLWFSKGHAERTKRVFFLLLPLFLCFWLPMVFSALDSYDPSRSWGTTAGAVRYLLAATAMGVLLHPRSLRGKVLAWSAFILLFWAVDGFVQLIFGYDLFGVPIHGDRLNALFFKKYQFYGPVMAMLSPLLLEYARRRWNGWAWAAAFAIIMGAVMIAGMRSGWVAMAMVIGVYAVLMLRRENRELRRITLAIPAIAIIVVAVSYAVSPLIQERVAQTLALSQGTTETLDQASSKRVPIFRAALAMYQDHPVNGVGVRAFSEAYLEYAEADDPHIAYHEKVLGERIGARHAHNIVLEAMADMGTIGVLALVAGFWFGLRLWRGMTPDQRQEAFPFVLALALVLFPVNTHFAIYGKFISSLVWVLVGLWASATEPPERPWRRRPKAQREAQRKDSGDRTT